MLNAIKKFFVVMGWVFFTMFALFVLTIVVAIGALSRGGLSQENLGSMLIRSDHAVGVAEIEGEIMTSKDFRKTLKGLVDNEKIKSIVVRIDSPGGAVGASEEMFAAIKAANAKKPVVCSMGSIAASGGFYAAMGCKKILANPGTLTGSIGVIMMTPNVNEIMGHYGVNMTVIKSGQYKDTGSPFRPVTPEDKQFLQNLVDAAYQEFVRVVSEARGLPVDKVKAFADGRILTGKQALEAGAIDELGDLDRAAKISLELAGDTEEPEIIMPKKPSALVQYFDESSIGQIFKWFRTMQTTQLLYQSFL